MIDASAAPSNRSSGAACAGAACAGAAPAIAARPAMLRTPLGQRALASPVQGLNLRHPQTHSQGLDAGPLRWVDHHQPRFRVAQEMLDFIDGVCRVDRHEDHTAPQARDVQEDRLYRSLDLDSNPVARGHAPLRQHRRVKFRVIEEGLVADLTAFGGLEEQVRRPRAASCLETKRQIQRRHQRSGLIRPMMPQRQRPRQAARARTLSRSSPPRFTPPAII